jgi:hypothetical protein
MHRLFDQPFPFLSTDFVQVARDESRYEIGIKIPKVSHLTMETVDGRQIDTRPHDPVMLAEDTDWGEQDSLANIPRKTMPTWVKALHLKDGE